MKRKLLARLLAATLVLESVLQGVGTIPVHAAGDIPIDAAHFPDSEFRKIMNQRYDTDHDGYLSEKERGVYNVVCEGNKNVKSMEGIEYFPDVRGIWCKDCDLAELDLSKNKEVVGVWCSGNPRITSLSFRENKKLEWVYCHDCNLTSLDVTQNEKLAYLEVNTNEHLGKLDVTHNKYLEHLTCGTCGLNELNLKNNTILTHLDAFQNNFTELDLTHNRELKRLDIWYNTGLGNIDVSIFPDLEFYNCAYNGVTELDVTHNESLMMLICSGNPELKELDLTHNHRLAWLRCMSTSVSELDISQCPQLYFCQVCHNPKMTTLDISNNSRLQKIVKDGKIDYSEYDGMNYDWVINYGGSTDYFDDLRYWFIVDDAGCTVTGKPTGEVGNGDPNYYDSFINTNDGASGDLVTRGEAIQTLYELAGRPGYTGRSDYEFSDIDGEFYEAAAKWGAEKKIALGYPNVYCDTFAGDKPISKQDLALMVHRYALAYGYDSAYDYGRTDHFEDSMDIDFYAWGAYTYAVQWQVVPTKGDYIYPHGRMTTEEFKVGLQNFKDHVGISKSVSVCTSGGSGTLTAQDQNNRHYKNHSESFGESGPSIDDTNNTDNTTDTDNTNNTDNTTDTGNTNNNDNTTDTDNTNNTDNTSDTNNTNNSNDNGNTTDTNNTNNTDNTPDTNNTNNTDNTPDTNNTNNTDNRPNRPTRPDVKPSDNTDNSSSAGNTFTKEAAVRGVSVIDGKHKLVLEVDDQGFFTDAVIYDADGNVDTDIDSYILNVFTGRKNDDGSDEFFSLVFTHGRWDVSYDSKEKGAYKYKGESYFVAGGVVNHSANGLQYTGETAGWKFLAAGKVVRDNAGLVMYEDEWFWIDKNGSCDQEYEAIVDWSGAKFLVHGGKLRTDFTGFSYDPQSKRNWYHITRGQVWGDGKITDTSIDGVTRTARVEEGVVSGGWID